MNLPEFELKELDNFQTIDDTLLAQILDKHEKENNTKTLNSNSNNNLMEAGVMVHPPMQKNSQINTQVINQNMPPNFPTMYFPNSNVTINYNFGK